MRSNFSENVLCWYRDTKNNFICRIYLQSLSQNTRAREWEFHDRGSAHAPSQVHEHDLKRASLQPPTPNPIMLVSKSVEWFMTLSEVKAVVDRRDRKWYREWHHPNEQMSHALTIAFVHESNKRQGIVHTMGNDHLHFIFVDYWLNHLFFIKPRNGSFSY